MSFRLMNTPATFQIIINNILRTMLNRFAMAYLDDITIYSETLEEHVTHVKQVLKILVN